MSLFPQQPERAVTRRKSTREPLEGSGTSAPHTGFGRRALLSGAGALIITAAVPRSADAVEYRYHSAVQAEKLADAFGVNVHLNFDTGVYGHQSAVVEKLLELGARHIRTRLVLQMSEVRRSIRALASHHCKVNATCQLFGDAGQPSNRELMREVVHYLGSDARHVFSSFEGINEPNNDGVPWVHKTRATTIDLWKQAKAHQATRDIPIIGPALADTWSLKKDYQRLGDLSRYTDLGSIHLYPRGTSPSILIDEHSGYARATFRRQPIVCTEGGYTNALNQTTGRPVPEAVSGIYAPRQLLEHFIRGNKFFNYELLDDVDPHGRDWQSNFGLLRVGHGHPSAWRSKPAFRAMRNLLEVVGDRGHSFRPSGLSMNVRGGGPELRTVLLQKRSGAHYLCMWRDVTVYNPETRHRLDVGKQRVDVSLKRAASVAVFEPSTQRHATRGLGSTRHFSLNLAGDLHVVRIS
jgi:hypothetical protein